MAKAMGKKRKRARVRDLKPRKAAKVKGGRRLSEDPCMGGQVTR